MTPPVSRRLYITISHPILQYLSHCHNTLPFIAITPPPPYRNTPPYSMTLLYHYASLYIVIPQLLLGHPITLVLPPCHDTPLYRGIAPIS